MNLSKPLAVLSILGFSFAGAASAQTVTGLRAAGTLSGSPYQYSTVNGVDASYTVVGESQNSNGDYHAFYDASVDGSGITDIGTLGGYSSTAKAINANSSLVVGESLLSNYTDTHAFAFDLNYNVLSDLGTLGGPNSSASGVNSSGDIAGRSDINNSGYEHAFLFTSGSMTDLGTLGGDNSAAFAISEGGNVVGYAQASNNEYHVFYYDASTASMSDLGTLGSYTGWAYAVNDTGGVVGASRLPSGVEHAFVYGSPLYGSGLNDLGSLNGASGWSAALGVNSYSDIIGYSDSSAGQHAFLCTGGTMYDLNTLAASYLSDGTTPGFISLDSASGINDNGTIVGTGTYYDGYENSYRAFVLSYTP
jgi:probable HAF family extracellular repeat protein